MNTGQPTIVRFEENAENEEQARNILGALKEMSHSLSELSFKIREIDDEALRQQMLRSIGEIMRQMDDGILDKVTKLHHSLSYEEQEE